MRAALRVEWLKLRRARVTLVATALLGLLLPAMGYGFYSVASSGGVGAVADKAAAFLLGEGWEGYVGMINQIAAVAGFLGIGIVVAWTFGREYTDRTFSSLFALTVPRGAIAAAKFIVVTIWAIALAGLVAVVAFIVALIGGVGPLGPEAIVELLRLMVIIVGGALLALTMGYVASAGRGYLAAIGAMAVIIAASQIAVLFGTGGWFPFAVPGLMAVAGAEGAPELNIAQVLLVPGVAALGIWLTVRWWRKAEVA